MCFRILCNKSLNLLTFTDVRSYVSPVCCLLGYWILISWIWEFVFKGYLSANTDYWLINRPGVAEAVPPLPSWYSWGHETRPTPYSQDPLVLFENNFFAFYIQPGQISVKRFPVISLHFQKCAAISVICSHCRTIFGQLQPFPPLTFMSHNLQPFTDIYSLFSQHIGRRTYMSKIQVESFFCILSFLPFLSTVLPCRQVIFSISDLREKKCLSWH